jgi:phosphatidate cytidylyltransferase
MSETREVAPILAVIVGALLIASVVGLVLKRRVHDERGKRVIQNLNARIVSWWVMVAVASSCCLAGLKTTLMLFALLSYFALREFFTLIPVGTSDRAAMLCSFVVVLPLQYALIWMRWYGMFVIFVPVFTFAALAMLALAKAETRNFLVRVAEVQWGVMIAVYCISYVPALQTLHFKGNNHRTALLVGFLLIVTQSSDVLQYVFGKLYGRRAIAPHISPSKTVHGFVGGVAGATLIGSLLWRITPFTWWQAMFMALLISLTGFAGGLVMSAIKRDRGIKDWGSIIGGHGGVLDRLDSVCFSAPVFFHVVRYLFA